MSLLKAEDIAVQDGATVLLSPITLHLNPGEPLIVLGETGSGKSLLAQALMGTLPPELRATGSITIGKRSLTASAPDQFRGLWGREITVLPQEPWLSLDPLMRARTQVGETHRLVRGLTAGDAARRADADLQALGLSGAERHYPHQLSGGMAQRVAIAAARAGGARIVIADEPTKGLDAARRDDVADLLLSEMGSDGGLLVITHDLALAHRIGGQLIVLRGGAVVEEGPTARVLSAPKGAYTRELIAANPAHWARRAPVARTGQAVVDAQRLGLARGGKMLFEDVGFQIRPGGVFGVTGPSGCGKSSLGDAVLGLVPLTSGAVHRAPAAHPNAFQKLYQDPVAAFPRQRRLGQALGDVARLAHRSKAEIDELMDRLGLDAALLDRRPQAVSGGELQRLALLRVLLRQPAFVFADEPTSRLDPITQAKVIGLLTEIAEHESTAIMLVSHDHALIDATADETLSLSAKGASLTSHRGFADREEPVVLSPRLGA